MNFDAKYPNSLWKRVFFNHFADNNVRLGGGASQEETCLKDPWGYQGWIELYYYTYIWILEVVEPFIIRKNLQFHYDDIHLKCINLAIYCHYPLGKGWIDLAILPKLCNLQGYQLSAVFLLGSSSLIPENGCQFQQISLYRLHYCVDVMYFILRQSIT